MGTADWAFGIEGNKQYQKRDRKALPILARQAKARRKIVYADLAEELGMPNPRNLNYPLGAIGQTLKELSESWGETIPQIQVIAVNQNTGLPGEGFEGFVENVEEFQKLEQWQKKSELAKIMEAVCAYEKWDLVLRELGLEPAPVPRSGATGPENGSSRRNSGGEGKEHRRLKQYVKDNPSCVGINRKILESEMERNLPSGDSMDVSFEIKDCWVGVEIKPRTADESDIERGLYQCVKYRAVMEGHLAVQASRKDVEVILALGRLLPKRLLAVKNILGVKVIENIVPSCHGDDL